MAAVKTKLGRIPCDCCGHPTMLKENEAGTLTMGCDECDVSSFAKKGTAAAARWRAKLPKEPDAPAAKELPGAAPGTVPKAPSQQPPKIVHTPAPASGPANPLDFFSVRKTAA